MKIAVIDMDNLKNPFWAAGQARATYEVCRLLAKNHQVVVYSSKYPGYINYELDGINYRHIGIESRSSKLTNLAFILSAPLIAHKIKSDLILENFNAPISVTLSPVFAKVPVVALPTMFNADQFTKKYKLPFHWVEKIGIKFYKYMLPYSDTDNSKAKQLNQSIVTKIVSQGVGKEYFKIKQKKPKHILFLGRFDIDQKGIDLLLRSYSKVSDKIGYPLVVAGHGPDEAKLKHLISELKLTKKVKIVGSAYGSKKRKLMSEALLAAFPSRHDEICLWALEALAGGLPLVCFDIPESRWLNEKVSLKARPFDIDDYARKLLMAVKPEIIEPKRKYSRSFAKKFSWNNVAKEFESFFEYVLRIEQEKRKS